MKEIWKDIEGYEGLYQVSNLGRVKSLNKIVGSGIINNDFIIKKGKELKAISDNKSNYAYVKLYNHNGNSTKKYIHRLVAEAFIPNTNNKPQVNHIDGNKRNNFIDNLEWNTRSENIIHAYSNNLKSVSGKQKKFCSKLGKSKKKKIKQYTLTGKFIKNWESMTDVYYELGLNVSNICSCCNGKRNQVGGYIWRYADDEVEKEND